MQPQVMTLYNQTHEHTKPVRHRYKFPDRKTPHALIQKKIEDERGFSFSPTQNPPT